MYIVWKYLLTEYFKKEVTFMIEKLGRQYFNQVAKLTLPVIGESKSHATE